MIALQVLLTLIEAQEQKNNFQTSIIESIKRPAVITGLIKPGRKTRGMKVVFTDAALATQASSPAIFRHHNWNSLSPFQTASDDNVKRFMDFLDGKDNLTKKDDNGWTVLHLAAKHNSINVLTVILQQGTGKFTH